MAISIQRFAADVFANYIASNITGLSGKVSAVSAGPETTAPCLALKILPEAFNFDPSDPDEVYFKDPDDGKVVVDIGSFSGMFTLQLYAISPAERELYEQKILDLFMATQWAPGTLYLTMPNVTVNGYASLYGADFKVFLETNTWHEELAFEAKRMTFLEVTVDFPALTTYDAATITSLQLALADMDQVVVTVADIDSENRVEIQDDGSVIPGTV